MADLLPTLKPLSLQGDAEGDPGSLKAKYKLKSVVKDWLDWLDYHERAMAPWRAERAIHRRRWENDVTLVKGMRGPQGRQYVPNNVVNQRPALKDWQHVISSPHGFVNEASRTAAMANLVEETNPRWTARGRQVEDAASERPLESLVDYQLAVLNPVTEWFREIFNRGYIQGVAPMKAAYRNESYTMNLLPRQWDRDRFRIRLNAALKATKQAIPPFIDPQTMQFGGGPAEMMAFVSWKNKVTQETGIEIPMPPIARNAQVMRNVGVKLDHIELPDLTWNGRIPTFREQPIIAHRMICSKKELLRDCMKRNREGRERGLSYDIFNLQAIENLQPGISTSQGEYASTQDFYHQVLRAIGYYDEPISDPMMVDAVEVVEFYEPACAEKGYGWCWVGQRRDVLTQPGHYPLLAPVHPFVGHFHIPSPGLSLGKSSYDYNTKDHDHLDTMRSLMADYVSVLVGQPLFRKGAGLLGETGRDLEIKPFSIIDAPMGVEYGPLYNVQQQLDGVLNYISFLKGDIDEGTAVDAVSRGQQATLNRVGVGEVQLRAQNQQARPRDEMHRAATMVTRDLIPLMILLVYQEGHPDHVINVAGGDPFEMMATDTLWPGLFANHMYMPAALDAAAAVVIQQLQETIKLGGEQGILTGEALLTAVGELWRMQRIPNADRIMDQARKALAEAKEQANLQGQIQQKDADLQKVVKENTGLRNKLMMPSMEEMNAEMQVIAQMQSPQQTPAAPAPPGNGAAPPAPPPMDAGEVPLQ